MRKFFCKISNFLDQQTGFTMLDRIAFDVCFWGLIFLYMVCAIEFLNFNV